MDNEEFFDKLYQLWSQSGTGRWVVRDPDESQLWDYEVISVDEKGTETFLFAVSSKAVADFIATAHGAIPELIERAMSALDESDRLDAEKDDLIAHNMQLELTIDELRAE